MFEAFPELVQIKAIGFYLLASIMRPLGLLTTFGLLNFAVKRSMMLRVGIAIALGAPVVAGNQAILFEIYLENQFFDRLLLAAKELLIGLAFGFLVSLPFYGFKYAGSLIDNYRGESSNQLPFEGHEVVTTLALAFYVTAAATFVLSDGLWYMMQSFYATYALWPLETYLPLMNPTAHVLILDQIQIVFRIMIQVGLPLLGLIFLAEFLLMIGSRIARRFGLNASAFIVKNLVLLLILPTYIGLVAIIADNHVDELFTADQIFGSFLK